MTTSARAPGGMPLAASGLPRGNGEPASRGQMVVRAEGLGKRYWIAARRRARARTLREAVSRWTRQTVRGLGPGTAKNRELPDTEVWALQDVAFAVGRGEALGIIGPNGAGKTTLLSIAAGVTEPTTGWLATGGRVASLLSVGAGFHSELTGRENVLLSGIVRGLRAAQVRRRFDEIVAFSGVERFIDTPVKRYSDGMYMRLAFAAAIHLEPEIVLVDEALVIGDAVFRERCLAKLEAARRAGGAILMVSHDLALIDRLCTRALRLENGRVVDAGPVGDVTSRYKADSVEHGRDGCVSTR